MEEKKRLSKPIFMKFNIKQLSDVTFEDEEFDSILEGFNKEGPILLPYNKRIFRQYEEASDLSVLKEKARETQKVTWLKPILISK